MNNEPITLEKLKEVAEKLKPKKIICMNTKTLEGIKQQLDFEPFEVKINNFIPDNTVYFLDLEQIEKMQKDFYKPKLI